MNPESFPTTQARLFTHMGNSPWPLLAVWYSRAYPGNIEQALRHIWFVLCNIRDGHDSFNLVETAMNREIGDRCVCSKNDNINCELDAVTTRLARLTLIHLVKLTTEPLGI